MVYLASAHELVLFGGLGSGNKQLQDTWTFTNGSWKPTLSTATHPPARWGAAMSAYQDSTSAYVLLFGGCGGYPCGGLQSDTWTWNASAGWVQLKPTTNPTPRGGAMMAMDAADGYAVLFGGGTYGPSSGWTSAGGYWTFRSGGWTVHPGTSPPSRAFGSLSEDTATGQLILFGGINGTRDCNDTWGFQSGAWGQLRLGSHPTARSVAAAVGSAAAITLVGGWCATSCGANVDVWVFESPPGAAQSIAPPITDVNESISFAGFGAGGVPPYRTAWDFGDGARSTAPVANHTYAAPGTFLPRFTIVDAAGVSVTSTGLVIVNAFPTLGFIDDPTTGDVGRSAIWSVSLERNGTLPDHVSWSLGDGTTGSGWSISHAWPRPGTYVLNATVVDSVGGTTTLSARVSVNPALTVAISTTPAVPIAGQPVVFFLGTSGGSDPLQITWSFGDAGTSTLTTPSHVFATGGNRTVTASVTDAVGATVNASIVLAVGTPASPPLTKTSTSPLGGWVGFGLGVSLIALGLAVVAVLLHYRRLRRQQEGEFGGPSAESGWLTARRRFRHLQSTPTRAGPPTAAPERDPPRD